MCHEGRCPACRCSMQAPCPACRIPRRVCCVSAVYSLLASVLHTCVCAVPSLPSSNLCCAVCSVPSRCVCPVPSLLSSHVCFVYPLLATIRSWRVCYVSSFCMFSLLARVLRVCHVSSSRLCAMYPVLASMRSWQMSCVCVCVVPCILSSRVCCVRSS